MIRCCARGTRRQSRLTARSKCAPRTGERDALRNSATSTLHGRAACAAGRAGAKRRAERRGPVSAADADRAAHAHAPSTAGATPHKATSVSTPSPSLQLLPQERTSRTRCPPSRQSVDVMAKCAKVVWPVICGRGRDDEPSILCSASCQLLMEDALRPHLPHAPHRCASCSLLGKISLRTDGGTIRRQSAARHSRAHRRETQHAPAARSPLRKKACEARMADDARVPLCSPGVSF